MKISKIDLYEIIAYSTIKTPEAKELIAWLESNMIKAEDVVIELDK